MAVVAGTRPTALEEFPSDLPTRFYLGESGIVLANGTIRDDFGCTWRATGKSLWGPKPAPREQVGDLTYSHGQWDATRYYGPRSIPLNGTVQAPNHATLHAAEQRFRDAIGVSAFTLRGTEPGFDSYTTVRQSGEVDWFEVNPLTATFTATLYARNPLLMSSLERSVGPVSFPTITGGLVPPITPPFTTGATVVSGSEDLFNPGSEPAGLRLRIDGPVGTMALEFPDLGLTQYLANPDGPLLTAGQWLTLDTETRQLSLNGDSRRRSWTYGDWLVLPPASTTTLAIRGDGYTTASQVSGTYRAGRI